MGVVVTWGSTLTSSSPPMLAHRQPCSLSFSLVKCRLTCPLRKDLQVTPGRVWCYAQLTAGPPHASALAISKGRVNTSDTDQRRFVCQAPH